MSAQPHSCREEPPWTPASGRRCSRRAAGAGEGPAADGRVRSSSSSGSDSPASASSPSSRPFDLVVLLTLSNTVQNAIIGEDHSVTGGMIGAVTLLVVNAIDGARSLFAHPRLERRGRGRAHRPHRAVDGSTRRPSAAEQMTRAELEAAAHRQGFASLAEVERAVLEAERQPSRSSARSRRRRPCVTTSSSGGSTTSAATTAIRAAGGGRCARRQGRAWRSPVPAPW